MKRLASYLLTILLLSSCTSSMDETLADMTAENETHTIIMNFDGNVEQFAQTRATTTFANGTMMYIAFSNGGSSIYGTAVYNSSIGNWEMTYTGSLKDQTNASCTLYYFVNPVSATSTLVGLNTSSISYKGTGAYTKTASSLNVTCTLNPNCSRIRFKGTSGKIIKITGLGYYNSLSMSSTSLAISSIKPTYEMSSTVQSSGYTPYIYYNDCGDNISITSDGTTYTIETPSAMKNYDGKSGYLTIPTSTSHAGWTTHAYVDLGTGVKWATCNIGANSPEEYGDYFAWGETTTKSTYDESTYKYCNGSLTTLTKYCTSSSYGTVDNKTVLEPEDDAAHVKWGGDWRMPTEEELDKLGTECYWQWVTSYNGKSVNGYIVYKAKSASDKGKKSYDNPSLVGSYSTSDPHIFLPAADYRYDSSLGSAGSGGYYWLSSLNSGPSCLAYVLSFSSDFVGWDIGLRHFGQSVRAVCP